VKSRFPTACTRPLQRHRAACLIIFRDGVDEPDEEFKLRLKNAGNGLKLGPYSELTVRIRGD